MLSLAQSILLALLGLFMLLPHASAQNFDHAGLAEKALNRHIRPGYAALFKATQDLEQSAKTFCSAPATRTIEPVRDAFRRVVYAWSRVAHLQFGPVTQERRLTRMLYWPDRKNLGRRQIRRALRTRDKSVLDQESLSGKSVAVQGLGAIEQLLYWKAEEAFADNSKTIHRCAYLQAATANIAGISTNLVNGWTDGAVFTRTFLNPGPDNPRYLKPSEVTLEIAKAFLVGMERLRDIKVAGSLGLRPNNRSKVRVPFEPSALSTRAMQAELEGLIDLFENGGLMQAIETQESGMGTSIRYEMGQALETFKRIELPIAKVLENPAVEDQLINTGFPLKNAREEASRVLAAATGLNLGFNALDGD